MTRRTRMVTAAATLTAALLVAGAFGAVRSNEHDDGRPVTGAAVAAVPAVLTSRGTTPGW